MKCTDRRVGRLITRYELGALDESEHEAFVSHLIECEYCHNEVYSMAPFMSVLRARRQAALQSGVAGDTFQPGVRRPSFWLRKPVLAAASVVVAVVAAVVAFNLARQPLSPGVAPRPGAAVPAEQVARRSLPLWTEVEIPRASYTPAGQEPELRDTGSASAFDRAMAAYLEGDFAAAAQKLEVVTRLEPEHAEAYFYWGVSLLLEGRSREAIAPLEHAVQLSVGLQQERSRYYLALAYLKSNRPQPALAQLETVVALNGSYRAQADRLRQKLMAAVKSRPPGRP